MTWASRPRKRDRRSGGLPARIALVLVALAVWLALAPRSAVHAGEIGLAYARPVAAPEGRPRIAVVVTGLGPSRAAASAAIRLPGEVTLGFSSNAADLQKWIDLARAAGHEVILDVPMEPTNDAKAGPGPNPLSTSLPSARNLDRLDWHLGRAIGYVGVTHTVGSRFVTSPDDLRPVLMALKERGVMFLDSRTSGCGVAARLASAIGLPRAINNRLLDARASRMAIDRQLGEIERIARRAGQAVAVGRAFPVTLERIDEWLPTLDEKGLALVPISGVVNRQPLP